MVTMAKEKENRVDDQKPVGRIAKAIQERRVWFENLNPLCPDDGLPSKFERYEGAYTRIHGIFKCPNGHEFNYSSRLKTSQQK